MILYHYEKPDRPITQGGFWFQRGGIANKDVPSWMAPMEYVPGWNPDYICCCDNLSDVLLYFPSDLHDRIGGVMRVYDYFGPIIKQKDAIMEYLTAHVEMLNLIETLSYEQAVLRNTR